MAVSVTYIQINQYMAKFKAACTFVFALLFYSLLVISILYSYVIQNEDKNGEESSLLFKLFNFTIKFKYNFQFDWQNEISFTVHYNFFIPKS